MRSIHPAYHFKRILRDPVLEEGHRALNSHSLIFLTCKMGLVAALIPVVDLPTKIVSAIIHRKAILKP